MATVLSTATLTTKVTPDEKKGFLEACAEIGTTPSNALRMFVSAFTKRGGFPFDTSNPYGFSAETLQAMDDAARDRNLSGPYKSTDEMWVAILDEEE